MDEEDLDSIINDLEQILGGTSTLKLSQTKRESTTAQARDTNNDDTGNDQLEGILEPDYANVPKEEEFVLESDYDNIDPATGTPFPYVSSTIERTSLKPQPEFKQFPSLFPSFIPPTTANPRMNSYRASNGYVIMEKSLDAGGQLDTPPARPNNIPALTFDYENLSNDDHYILPNMAVTPSAFSPMVRKTVTGQLSTFFPSGSQVSLNSAEGRHSPRHWPLADSAISTSLPKIKRNDSTSTTVSGESEANPSKSLFATHISPSGVGDFESIKPTARRFSVSGGEKKEFNKKEFFDAQAQILSKQRQKKHIIVNVHNMDRSYKTLVLHENMLARDVCELMLIKNHRPHNISCQLMELLVDEGLDRLIEDHENVTKIYESWPENSQNRFLFRHNFKKFDIFQNTSVFVHGMHSGDSSPMTPLSPMSPKSGDEKSPMGNKAEQAKEKLLQEMIMNTDRTAELAENLWIKYGKKKWKNVFCMLRPIGIYYSNRGTSKDPKHLTLLVDFSEVDMYYCRDEIQRQRFHFSPTPDLVVFVNKVRLESPKERVCLCMNDEKIRLRWQQGIRLAKYGLDVIRNNYQTAVKRHEKLKRINSKAAADKAAMAATTPSTVLEKSIASWLVGPLDAESAAHQLTAGAAESGTFLIREWQGQRYLSLLHNGSVSHFEIKQIAQNDEPNLLSLDNGETSFLSLNALVEYYKNNRGVLPWRLHHSSEE